MNEKIIEYDKRMEVPKFEGWEEREIEAETKLIKRLMEIFATMNVSQCDTEKQVRQNLKWFYRNLHVHNRRHKDFLEAIDIIEELLSRSL